MHMHTHTHTHTHRTSLLDDHCAGFSQESVLLTAHRHVIVAAVFRDGEEHSVPAFVDPNQPVLRGVDLGTMRRIAVVGVCAR
jgi:hypothetical protein